MESPVIQEVEKKENPLSFLAKKIEREGVVGSTFDFSDPDQEKSTCVMVKNVNNVLGFGDFSSWVASVNVELVNGSHSRLKNMVIKKFAHDADFDGPALRQSYDNFKRCKAAGLPTWTTYRINEEHRMALMTLGTHDASTLRTANDYGILREQHTQFDENPVLKINNLDDLALKCKDILTKEDVAGIRLRRDAYGVIFQALDGQPGVYNVDILVADFDSIDDAMDPRYSDQYSDIKTAWQEENVVNMADALRRAHPGKKQERKSFADMVMEKVNTL